MPFRMWNQATMEYELKTDDAEDIFDILEQLHTENERGSSRAMGIAKDAIRRDIVPLTKDEIRSAKTQERKCVICGDFFQTRPDSLKNVCSEDCRSKTRRFFCKYCGEETTEAKWSRRYCGPECKVAMSEHREEQRKIRARNKRQAWLEEVEEMQQWEESRDE